MRIRDRPILSRLDAAAVEVFNAFDAAGVDALLLKGPVLARVLYGPTEHRGYVDVDVLVAPNQFRWREADTGRHRVHQPARAAGSRRDRAGPGCRDLGPDRARARRGPDDRPPPEADRLRSSTAGRVGRDVTAPHLDRARRPPSSDASTGNPRPSRSSARRAARRGHPAARWRTSSEAIERWPPDVWRGADQLALELQATATFAAGLRQLPQGVELARRSPPAGDRRSAMGHCPPQRAAAGHVALPGLQRSGDAARAGIRAAPGFAAGAQVDREAVPVGARPRRTPGRRLRRPPRAHAGLGSPGVVDSGAERGSEAPGVGSIRYRFSSAPIWGASARVQGFAEGRRPARRRRR